MYKQLIHYGAALVGLLTALSAAVLSATSTLPGGNYKQMGLEVAGVLGAAAIGFKGFDNAIAQQHLDASTAFLAPKADPEPTATAVEPFTNLVPFAGTPPADQRQSIPAPVVSR